MPSEDDQLDLGLPAWFRGMLIAIVMVMLCSCQAPRVDKLDTGDSLKAAAEQPAEQSTVRLVGHEESTAAEPVAASLPHVAVDQESVDMTSEQSASAVELSPSDFPAPRVALTCPAPGCDDGACQAPCDAGACQSGSCPAGGCPSGGNVGAGCGCTGCAVRGPLDEYLCDGGDCGLPVGVRPDWSIDGLEQEDTVAHYDTLDGRVLVEPSNRVCIYAPRFGAVRRVVHASESLNRELINVFEDDMALAVAEREDLAATTLQQLPPVTKIGELPPNLLINRQQAGEFEARVVVRELKGMIKPYCDLQVVRLGVVDNAEKPWLAKATVSARTWTGDQAAQVTIDTKAASVLTGIVAPGVMYADQGGKPCLRLIKLASTDHAQPGDEVSFTLRFDNVGTQEIGNVTIVDNLTTRLAYVPDSAEASLDADFSTSENGAGSVVLRWEITEPLKPGEGGVLQFRAKVR
ncbi:MAG: hypothetical protein AAF589_03285 [Planctomycetota bacterium]